MGATAPGNRALAEAFFAMSEEEPLGERRVALLKAGYTALDAPRPARREVLRQAPAWLKPIVSQLARIFREGSYHT